MPTNDPYNVPAAVGRKIGKDEISKKLNLQSIVDLLGKVQQHYIGSGGGGGYSGGGYSGGGGAPASTLAGLPQTAALQELIKKGLIREGMPQEQALAILAIQSASSGVPIDVNALLAMINANYDNYSGDIMTAGQDWMQQLYGAVADPNDPNAALFAQDPIFSSYAGGMAQIDETADLNRANDLSWINNQGQAMTDYYNALMAGISSGGIPVGGSGGGGGGGGGGHYGGGGYGGGGSGGGGDSWSDVRTRVSDTEKIGSADKFTNTAYNPEFWNNMMAANAGNPDAQDWIRDFLAKHPRPVDAASGLVDARDEALAGLMEAQDININNAAWEQQAPAELQDMLSQYMQATGYVVGDNPETNAVEPYYLDPNAAPDVLLPGQEDIVNPEGPYAQIFQQMYGTQNMPGGDQPYGPTSILSNYFNNPRFRELMGLGALPQPEGPDFERNKKLAQGAQAQYTLPNITGTPFAEDFVTGASMQPPTLDDYLRMDPDSVVANLQQYGLDNLSQQDVDVLAQNISTREGDEWAPVWDQFTSTVDNSQYSGNTGTEEDQGDPQAAVWSAVRNMQDPQALHFFFTDSYPDMTPAEQEAVDNFFNQRGISTPNSQAPENITPLVPGSQTPVTMPATMPDIPSASDMRIQAMAQAARTRAQQSMNQYLAQNNLSIPDWMQGVAEAPEYTLGQYYSDWQQKPLSERNDVLTALQSISQDAYNTALNEYQGPDDQFHAQPGQYWHEPMSEADISDWMLQYQTALANIPVVEGINPNVTMAPTIATSTDTASQTSQISDQSTTYDPYYADLAGIGDPDQLPYDQIDLIAGGPTDAVRAMPYGPVSSWLSDINIRPITAPRQAKPSKAGIQKAAYKRISSKKTYTPAAKKSKLALKSYGK